MENNYSKHDIWGSIENSATKYSNTKHKTNSILVANFQYIDWLEAFCISHPFFCDDDWDFYPMILPLDVYEQVKRLAMFYNEIFAYAQQNHLDTEGNKVFVSFNNIGYEIGHDSGNSYYCRRKDISSAHPFIDFNEIIYNTVH